MRQAQLHNWRPVPLRKGSLVGFAEVEFPSGQIIANIAVHTSERGPWASPPGKQMVGADGVAQRDAAGKFRWVSDWRFRDKATRDRFSATVIDAVRAAHPEAFIT